MRVFFLLICSAFLIGCSNEPGSLKTLQPKSDRPDFFEFNEFQIKQKVLYVPATVGTVKWGYLPNANDSPVASMESGSYLVVDALSHEGILEDQGRDPLTYFAGFGVQKEDILNDAVNIALSKIDHDFHKDGPHVVIGPIEIKNTEPGDILKIDIIMEQPLPLV